MTLPQILIILLLISTVIIFLFSIKKFSKEIRRLFGGKIEKTLKTFTNTTLKGVLSGIGITPIIQSSVAVTVMLVSLADAGLISLKNSLGVIIGSNIGITITVQFIAFNIFKIAPFFLILGFILTLIKHPRNKLHRFGKIIFYFGLVFTCLFIIFALSGTFKESALISFLVLKSSNVFFAIIVGTVIAMILQSSSITIGLVVVLASSGVLDFSQSFGIILGANIGTTIPALVASLMTGLNGKRVAMAHFVFNFLGVIIFLPFVKIFSDLIVQIPVGTKWQVALSHLVFNIVIGIIFIMFIKPYEKLILKIVR